MNEPPTNDPPTRPARAPETLAAAVARLAESVQLLTARLDKFEAGMRTCITTERVEVIADDDAPCIVISADDRRASVEVRTRAPAPHSIAIELFAADQEDDNPAQVGLEVTDAGDVVASLATFEHARPTLWLATDDDHPARPGVQRPPAEDAAPTTDGDTTGSDGAAGPERRPGDDSGS